MWRWWDKGSPSSPQFVPVYFFRVVALSIPILNFDDPTISEPGASLQITGVNLLETTESAPSKTTEDAAETH